MRGTEMGEREKKDKSTFKMEIREGDLDITVQLINDRLTIEVEGVEQLVDELSTTFSHIATLRAVLEALSPKK